MKNIAIVGLGRWGKNLLKEYSKISNVLICASKGNEKNLSWLHRNYPNVSYTTNLNNIFNNESIDAIVIATPINTHQNLVIRALESRKHVFIEKPLATTISDSTKIIKLAQKKHLILFVGHIFLHHQIFQKIKSISKRETLLYARFDWSKKGTFGEDIFFNLLSHDIAISLELFGLPKKYSLIDDVGYVTKSDIITIGLKFNESKKCVININRISNFKKKIITLITTKNLYVWDGDTLYKFNKAKQSFQIIYRAKITSLESECNEFIKQITTRHIDYRLTLNAIKTTDTILKIKKQK